MPAGRPVTTGQSPHASFRARGQLGDHLEKRRAYPDIRNDPFYGGPVAKDGHLPAIGAVAARDLVVYYSLLDTELADAAAELSEDQALSIVHALWGLAIDPVWVTAAPELLAGEIEDDRGDDEDGPGDDRKALAAKVRAWPRIRALAVVEAALALRGQSENIPMPEALVKVGLQRPSKGRG